MPVIRQAEDKSFLGIARAIVDLAERARGKKLKPEEVGFWHLHDYESRAFSANNSEPRSSISRSPRFWEWAACLKNLR